MEKDSSINREPELTEFKLEELGRVFLDKFAQAQHINMVMSRTGAAAMFENPTAGNKYAVLVAPDNEDNVKNFIFWQLLTDEEGMPNGMNSYVLSFTKSGNSLQGVVCIDDQIESAREAAGIDSKELLFADVISVASIVRGAEAEIASDEFSQSPEVFQTVDMLVEHIQPAVHFV